MVAKWKVGDKVMVNGQPLIVQEVIHHNKHNWIYHSIDYRLSDKTIIPQYRIDKPTHAKVRFDYLAENGKIKKGSVVTRNSFSYLTTGVCAATLTTDIRMIINIFCTIWNLSLLINFSSISLN